ncbi:MAG TPA: MarC family protein [Chthoniobacterales bacterium]|jgi:multiple antibiotic resistance protein
MLEKIIRDFVMTWTTIDPISTLAVFAGLTGSLGAVERRRIAGRATLYAAAILIVAVVIGQIVLDAMGVRLLSLQVAGGIILFLFGLQMLFGSADRETGPHEKGRDLAVFPLAVPTIAGPGAIMAVILLTDNDVYTVREQAETAVVVLVVLALTYLFLLASGAILRVIGRQGAAILTRVMGILLAALSIELILTALRIGSWAAPKH